MKILITAPSLDEKENVSGISTVVRQIIENSRQEFSHFTAGRKDGKKNRSGWIFDQTSLVPKFLLKIKREKPDILHLNTALTSLAIGRDAILAKVAGALQIPVLLHIHGGKFFTEDFSNQIFVRLTEKMLHHSSIIITLSEIEKTFIKRYFQNLDVRVLHNAVPLGEALEREGENNIKTIIYLGRFHEGKGLKEIIEACQILKNENYKFRFRCFGAGVDKDLFVEQMTEILGKDFVYGGVVSGEKKWKALAESDIFLLPSHYEGLPMALLEAMASGCIPIVSDVGSVGKIIEDEINGFLIKPRDVSQIVGRLKYLLSDKTDRNELRQNAKKTIEERFELTDYISKLESIYREII